MLLRRISLSLVRRSGVKSGLLLQPAATSVRSRTMSADETHRIAIAQMQCTNDKEANMGIVRDLLAKAKTEAATFLFLPECCDFIGENHKQVLELSEPLNGPTMQQYKQMAKENGMWLSLGGVHELICRAADNTAASKIYNSHVLIDAAGDIVSVYRKLHLFDVNTKEMRFRESDIVEPGTELVPPVRTPIGRLGMQICYDMRFPETSLLLRKMGAQILTYPSAFAYTTGKDHWEVLLRARAIENQCFVVAPAQIGYHNKKRRSWGHAMAVGPWGLVLADCGGSDTNIIQLVELDFSGFEAIRSNMPTFKHRRDDRYSLTSYDACTTEIAEDRQFGPNTINKETIFYESEHCYAFTNLRCVVEGHVLVSTKRQMARLSGLTSSEIADLFMTVCKMQRLLEKFYQTSSATVTVQDGCDAGQTVPHVHFHVMPRRRGDFEYNDQVYIKLDDRCLDKPDRSIEERIAEAQKYKEFMATMNAETVL